MAVVFSKVTIEADGDSTEFLVSGSPRSEHGLKGWVAYENFIKKHEAVIKAHIQPYSYGNSRLYKATPEEVAYLTMRWQQQPDFLETRCSRGLSRTIYLKGGITMNEFERLRRLSIVKKKEYPHGTRLLLNHMDDPHAPVESGTRGTVVHVDDQAQIHMKWDNGRTLALNVETDSFRKLTEAELAEEKREKQTRDFGDECQIVIPEQPIDCSRLGYFDELEYECWDLVKRYCEHLGIEILPNEDGEEAISFDIAKGIQDKIIEELQQAGVEFKFEEQTEEEKEEIDEGETNGFMQKM